MFAALRSNVTRQRPTQLRIQSLRRCFATETAMPSAPEEETEEQQRERYEKFLGQKALEKPARPQLSVPVEKDHGLYLFFRQLIVDDVPTYETVESKLRPSTSVGRSWNPTELRRKSFMDLHTLWYIVLRERNLLATQRAEAKRLGINEQYLDIGEKDRRCRKTMARIKTILSERMHAYGDAYAIQREHRDEAQERRERAIKSKEHRLAAERRAARKVGEDDQPMQMSRPDASDISVERLQPRRGRMTRRNLRKSNLSGQVVVETGTAGSPALG